MRDSGGGHYWLVVMKEGTISLSVEMVLVLSVLSSVDSSPCCFLLSLSGVIWV